METSLIKLLLEGKAGFSQNPVYYFTTLKDAGNILASGHLYTTSVKVARDSKEGRPDRFVSFTRSSKFDDGYPHNTDIDQQKKTNQVKRGKHLLSFTPKRNSWGDIEYEKKQLIALVRFEIDTDILESLIEQSTNQPLAEPFEFDLDMAQKKPEQEERLWLLLQQIDDFPRCIKSICFNSEHSSETDYMNQLAQKVFIEAKKLGIPCFERDFSGREFPLKTADYLYTPSMRKKWGKGKEDADLFAGKYKEFVTVAAVCCLRNFSKTRQGTFSYLSRFSKYLSGEQYHQFLLDIEAKAEEFLKDPAKLNNIKQTDDWVLGKKFEGNKDLQHELDQMVYRSRHEAKVTSFDQLCTYRRNQIQAGKLSENLEENSSVYTITKDKLEQDAEREFQYGYDYSKVPDKVKTNVKVPIICPVHGEFLKSPENLKRGFGCPRCTESQPERVIARHLRAEGVEFSTQVKVFCVDGRERPIDFYFPDFYGPSQDAAIEVQGPSHSGGIPTRNDAAKAKQDAKLARQKTSDMLKKQYCEDNGVTLEYIPKDSSEPLARSIGGLEKQADEALERLEAKRPVSEARDFNFEDYILEGWMHKEA